MFIILFPSTVKEFCKATYHSNTRTFPSVLPLLRTHSSELGNLCLATPTQNDPVSLLYPSVLCFMLKQGTVFVSHDWCSCSCLSLKGPSWFKSWCEVTAMHSISCSSSVIPALRKSICNSLTEV